MGPNKPKKGQRTKNGEQASGEADNIMGEAYEEGIVIRVMEAITDERILTLLKKALYPQPLDDKLRMNDIIEALTKTISERDARAFNNSRGRSTRSSKRCTDSNSIRDGPISCSVVSRRRTRERTLMRKFSL